MNLNPVETVTGDTGVIDDIFNLVIKYYNNKESPWSRKIFSFVCFFLVIVLSNHTNLWYQGATFSTGGHSRTRP